MSNPTVTGSNPVRGDLARCNMESRAAVPLMRSRRLLGAGTTSCADRMLYPGTGSSVWISYKPGASRGVADACYCPELPAADSYWLAEPVCLVMLRRARHYGLPIKLYLKHIASLIEQLALITLTLVYGVIVASVILPLYKRGHAIG